MHQLMAALLCYNYQLFKDKLNVKYDFYDRSHKNHSLHLVFL